MTVFAGEFTEEMRGEELSRLVTRHWNVSPGDTIYFDEVARACKRLNVSIGDVADFIDLVNESRHHDPEADVMKDAFVPAENIPAVVSLLDQVKALCVRM